MGDEMNFCPGCGQPLQPNTIICPKCGRKLNVDMQLSHIDTNTSKFKESLSRFGRTAGEAVSGAASGIA